MSQLPSVPVEIPGSEERSWLVRRQSSTPELSVSSHLLSPLYNRCLCFLDGLVVK